MATAVIACDKDLPELPGCCPWKKPASFLAKNGATATAWRVVESGRRKSKLLLAPMIRAAVDAWQTSSNARNNIGRTSIHIPRTSWKICSMERGRA